MRVHTGPAADASARAIGALAYTVGRDVVFRDGAHAPATRPGRRVLAHELAHVVQQRSAPSPSPALLPAEVGPSDHPLEREAGAAAGAVLAGRPVPPLSADRAGAARRADPDEEEAATALPEADRDALAGEGIDLDAADESLLADLFPHGFHLEHGEVSVLGTGASTAVGYRMAGVRVVEPAPLLPGVETWIFHVGKARAILVSSRGSRSGSVMLDTGFDERAARGPERLASAMEALAGRGLAEAPRRVVFSHTDADHMNAAAEFLRSARLASATVEIAQEQLRGGVGARDWAAMRITLQPTQQLVEIHVTGAGGAAARAGPAGGEVHVHRVVVGNFEMTEFRSVSAHAAVGARRAEKNRTSPVTVVTDLVTGERSIYTADAVGRQFNEIISAVGEDAFRRIVGAEGRNVRLVEYPHHGGAVGGSVPRAGGGSDASGMIRFLRLAFEGSDGSVRLFTQTRPSFAGGASASIRFLDTAGVDVARIVEGAETGPTTVTRARGSALHEVTMDAGAVRSVVEVARARETEIMRAYQLLHRSRTLGERASAMSTAFSMAGMPAELSASVDQTRADLRAAEAGVRQAVDRVWNEMEAAARGRAGMRAGRDTSRVTAELGALGRHLEGVDLTRHANALEAHEANLSAYARLFTTALEMRDALRAQRYQDLNALRGRLNAEVRLARGILGPAEVDAHVRSAWAAVRANFDPERIRVLSARLGFEARRQRIQTTHFRVLLAESLGRQMQLNELMARASHGGRTARRPDGTVYTPARTRAGAGFLALIEVMRIGLELYHSYEGAEEAAEERAARNRVAGTETAAWWIDHGAEPEMALVARGWLSGYDTVSDGMTREEIRAAVAGERTEGVPEHEMVVVEGVSRDDLLFLVHSLYLELSTLEEWLAFNGSYPQGPLFRKFGDDWAVLLWDREEGRYLYHLREALREPLDQLMALLETGQEELLASRVEEAGGDVHSVSDTGWFSQERLAYAFNSAGNLREIDFGSTRPRFLRAGGVEAVGRADLVPVQAADMETWRVLSRHHWRRRTGTWIGAHGSGGTSYAVFRNRRGMAYVDPDDLVPAP